MKIKKKNLKPFIENIILEQVDDIKTLREIYRGTDVLERVNKVNTAFIDLVETIKLAFEEGNGEGKNILDLTSMDMETLIGEALKQLFELNLDEKWVKQQAHNIAGEINLYDQDSDDSYINETEDSEDNSINISITDFPDYEEMDRRGSEPFSDSNIFELDFDRNGISYSVETEIRIKGVRYYYPGSQEQPEDVGFSVDKYGVNCISGTKYENDNDVELSDEDLKEISQYIGENLVIND